MTKTNTPEIYGTQILHKRLKFKLAVGRSSSRVSRHGHSETESELTELTIYIRYLATNLLALADPGLMPTVQYSS